MKWITVSFLLFFIVSSFALVLEQTVTDPFTGNSTTYREGQVPEVDSQFNCETLPSERISERWNLVDGSAIVSDIAVSSTTDNSLVGWYLNNPRNSLYSDTNIPIWEMASDNSTSYVDITPDGTRFACAEDTVVSVYT
ncbi:MAG: hypothetical protein K8S56_00735, partial [Candidatus Cloacimonetes bacterium]|nr:hypothetical protein [Candidatus Cloacimonadota bacterium]